MINRIDGNVGLTHSEFADTHAAMLPQRKNGEVAEAQGSTHVGQFYEEIKQQLSDYPEMTYA